MLADSVKTQLRAAAAVARHAPILASGALRHQLHGTTPEAAYQSMRRVFVHTRGGLADAAAALMARMHRPYALPEPVGVLGDLRGRMDEVLGALDRDGFWRADVLLDPAACDELVALGLESTCFTRSPRVGDARYDPRAAPIATQYQLYEQDLVDCEATRRLLVDPSVLAVVQRYLGCAPVCDLVTMWWTTAFSQEASSESAQLFHYDLDRLRFLKLFVYLTDVGPDNGPHTYVLGSHRERPPVLFEDGRHSDETVAAAFPADRINAVTGPKGTIFLADTSGMHKGTVVRDGHRLLFEIEWAISLFGNTWTPLQTREAGEQFAAAMQAMPRLFERWSSAGA